MLDELVKMARQVKHYKFMDDYCRYVNIMLSAGNGQECCMVVGSTKDGTRLRTEQDPGDFDFLLVGEATIPVDSLRYREDLPCFVHIDGRSLKQLDRKCLIDGEYLPATLVKKLDPLFFGRLKSIHDFLCRPLVYQECGTSRLVMNTEIKPGMNVIDFIDCQSEVFTFKSSKPVDELRKQCARRVEQSVVFQNSSNGVAHVMETLSKLLQHFKSKDNSDSYFFRTFGPLLKTLASERQVEFMCSKQESEIIISGECIDDSIDGDTIGQGQRKEEKFVPNGDPSCLPVKPDKPRSVRARYAKKGKMMDFIPALRLSEPPKYITDWTRRVRFWPRKQTVDAISKSQFFVVAKPAVKDERREVDFCLSCNLAEIMLAKEMPPGHMKCLLMIKAFQRTILQEYSNILTTFHWKTAMYWMLESTDPRTYSENSEDILNVLRDLLDYMRDRLHEGWLQHYFFPSNLFAGLKRDFCIQIVKKIEEIYFDPRRNLYNFFLKIEEEDVNVIDIPLDKMKEMKKKINEESYFNSVLDMFESIGRSVSSTDERSASKQTFPNMVLKIAKMCIQEERTRLEKENNTAEVGASLKEDVFSALADLVLKRSDESDRKRLEEALIKNLASFLLVDD